MDLDILNALHKMLSWYQHRADQELIDAVNMDLPMHVRRKAGMRRNYFLKLAQDAFDKATASLGA